MSLHLHQGGKVFDSLVAEEPPDPAPSDGPGTIDEKPVSRAIDPSCSRISFDFCKAKNPRHPTESLVASFNLQLFEPAVISLIVISAGELPYGSPRRIREPPPCSSKFRVIRLRKSRSVVQRLPFEAYPSTSSSNPMHHQHIQRSGRYGLRLLRLSHLQRQ